MQLLAAGACRRSFTSRHNGLSEMESEEILIHRAQQALSQCNWTIGECASQWTQRYAQGRTDADFGQLIGLSGDQVYQRRRVWETFADVYQEYPALKWSHFYVALNWNDAAEALQWANEMEATVAEMKAWRRALLGEDLSSSPIEEPPFDLPAEFLTPTTAVVRDPGDLLDAAGRPRGEGGGSPAETEALAAANRMSGASDYAPFNPQARGNAPESESAKTGEVSTEQLIKRVTGAIERCVAALTPDVLEEFADMPFSVQQRFRNAISQLQDRIASLE
jgi:hypothetical protein